MPPINTEVHGIKTLHSEPEALATVLSCGGEHNFLLHIFTSLQRKQRFFKYLFNIHTLFLRLRFRLVRQEIPLRVGFQIRRSLWTKERAPFGKLRDREICTVSELVELAVKLRARGSFSTVSELVELAVKLRAREICTVCLHLP